MYRCPIGVLLSQSTFEYILFLNAVSTKASFIQAHTHSIHVSYLFRILTCCYFRGVIDGEPLTIIMI